MVYDFVVLSPGAPKDSPAVVMLLKRLRRPGHGLKSHPTDWEKPGIKLVTPGLQDICLSPTPRRRLIIITYCDEANKMAL